MSEFISVHLGAEEGDRRKAELERVAEQVGAIGQRGASISILNQMIADGDLEVRMATKVGDRVKVNTIDGAIRNAEATIIGTIDDAVQGVMYEVEFDEPQKIGTKHKTSQVKPFECFPLDTTINVVPNSSAID